MTVAEPKEEAAAASSATGDAERENAGSDTDAETGGAGDEPPSAAVVAEARPAAPTNARRPVAFQASHALKFGLEVVAHDPSTGRVAAVLCLFCKHFGREPKAGAKRRATTNFKYFKGVFRTDQYLQHHRLQHPIKWAEYDAASVREKQTFFPRYLMAVDSSVGMQRLGAAAVDKDKSKRQRRLESGSGDEGPQTKDPAQEDHSLKKPGRFEIPSGIAGLLFGAGLWQPHSIAVQRSSDPSNTPDDLDTAMFGTVEADGAFNGELYRGEITDRLCFDVTVGLCASGLTTPQITRAMRAMAPYVANSASLSSAWDDLVDNFTQVATMGSLTALSKLLDSSWAFSIGLHRHGAKTVAARVRFFHLGLQDFHLCCLPCEGAKDTLFQILDRVHPMWRQSLVGVSFDGDLYFSKEASLIPPALKSNSDAGEKLWITWNGGALLETALTHFFNQLQNGHFAVTFRNLKSYIKSHSRLIEEIGHEVQPPGATRNHDDSVSSIFATSGWFTEKRVRIRKFLEELNEPESTRPSESWWLCLAIFHWIATPVDNLIQIIRTNFGGLVPMTQIAQIKELRDDVANAFRVTSMDTAPDGSGSVVYESPDRSCAASKTGILEFIVELGSFVNSLLTTLRHEELDVALESLGRSLAAFVETLQKGLTHAGDVLELGDSPGITSPPVHLLARSPPVLPHDFAKLNGKEFSALVDRYKAVLTRQFSDERFDMMDQEHQALKRATREKDFREWSTDALVDRSEEFDGAWQKTTGRFRILQVFAGGLASVLPRQRRSLIHHEDHTAPSSKSVLSIAAEAPSHATQFHQLCALLKPQSVVI